MKLNIKKVVEQKKMSVAQISRDSGLSKVQLFKIIDSDGVNPMSPKVDTLLKVAEALGVSFFDLFDKTPVDSKPIFEQNENGDFVEIGYLLKKDFGQ